MGATTSLKKLAVVGFSLGAGFAVAATLIVWVYSGYSNRVANKWKEGVITARFKQFDVAHDDKTGKPSTLIFSYVLENNSDTDYQLNKGDYELFTTSDTGELQSTGWEGIVAPVFVPQKTAVEIDYGATSNTETYSILSMRNRAKIVKKFISNG